MSGPEVDPVHVERGAALEMRIVFAGDDLGTGAESLRVLLMSTDAIRGSRVTPVAAMGEHGKMSGVTEALLVALGSGGAGVVVLQTVLGWLRRQGPKVKLTITAEGATAEVEAATVKQAQEAAEIIDAFRSVLGQDKL